MQNSQRVLIIGLDGATWDILDRWMQDGTLPNLAGLRQRGSWGPLRSSTPPITAAAWSTFMTGKRPGKHGVFHFINLFGEDGVEAQNSKIVDARSIQSPALWDVLGHHDRRVGLVNIPLTYPPRPVNGVMVTGLLTPRNAPVFTYPAELSREITDYKIDLDRFADKVPFQDAFEGETIAPSLALMEEFRDMLEKRVRVTRSLMASAWDFFMVVFIGTDRMGHYLWPFHRDPAPNDSPEIQQLCRAVREYYIRLDEVVGDLVETATENTRVIIMSDHGMGLTYRKQVHCNNWLEHMGWLTPTANGAAGRSADGWLKRLGLPRDRIGAVVRKIPGLSRSRLVNKARASRSANVDADRSKAYGVPIFFNIMGIRVNGVGAEKEVLCQDIIGKLPEIIDPDTGKSIVTQVYRGRAYYQGPYAQNTPDIIVHFDPTYGCNYHLSHYSAFVTRRAIVSGPAKHRMEGIFIAAGPGIAASGPQPVPNLHIEDVAPTALHLMGLSVPTDMDGRVLTEILESSFLRAQPITYEEPMGFWTEPGQTALEDTAMSPADEAIIRERLQSLGYFD